MQLTGPFRKGFGREKLLLRVCRGQNSARVRISDLVLTDVGGCEEEMGRRKSKREVSHECSKALEPANPVKFVHLYLTLTCRGK